MENNLRRRVIETYKKTTNIIRIGERTTKNFWMERGMRQGCSLRPTLFNIYVMNLENEMKKKQTGGVTVRKVKY